MQTEADIAAERQREAEERPEETDRQMKRLAVADPGRKSGLAPIQFGYI